jgi:hypothetical protein
MHLARPVTVEAEFRSQLKGVLGVEFIDSLGSVDERRDRGRAWQSAVCNDVGCIRGWEALVDKPQDIA